MSRIIAKTLSFLFHPFVVFIYAPYIFIGKSSGNTIYTLKWVVISYLFLAATFLFVFIGVNRKLFSDFDISKREQRPLLFWFVGIVIFLYLLCLMLFDGPKILYMIVFLIILGVAVTAVVNKWWTKASIHVATVSGFLLTSAIMFGGVYFLLLLLIPFIGWSRVKIHRHTPLDVAVGAILGILLTLIIYIVGSYFFI